MLASFLDRATRLYEREQQRPKTPAGAYPQSIWRAFVTIPGLVSLLRFLRLPLCRRS